MCEKRVANKGRWRRWQWCGGSGGGKQRGEGGDGGAGGGEGGKGGEGGEGGGGAKSDKNVSDTERANNSGKNKVSVGAPLPPCMLLPQAVREPSGLNATNAPFVESIVLKPVSVGAPLPPALPRPQAVISRRRTARR